MSGTISLFLNGYIVLMCLSFSVMVINETSVSATVPGNPVAEVRGVWTSRPPKHTHTSGCSLVLTRQASVDDASLSSLSRHLGHTVTHTEEIKRLEIFEVIVNKGLHIQSKFFFYLLCLCFIESLFNPNSSRVVKVKANHQCIKSPLVLRMLTEVS